jgi:hypothetical protein
MMGDSTKKNFKAMLAGARLPEKTVPICLRGDLVAEFERLDRQLQEARRKPADSLAGTGEGEILDRMETVRQQMQDNTCDVVLRAKPKAEWRALCADHSPRKTDDGTIDERDVMLGVNAETFFDAIIRACMIDPELDDQTWAEFEAALTDRQFQDLAEAAWAVNRSDVDIPFLPAASRNSRDSGGE